MDYTDLIVYQKARQVATGVHQVVMTWPRDPRTQDLARQLFRAATSVGANIAEGHGRHEGAEYVHYLYIAQGSANEVDHWLTIAIDCGIGVEVDLRALQQLNSETRRLLTSIRRSIQRKHRKTTHESPWDPHESD
jgi:four helix bundle protein